VEMGGWLRRNGGNCDRQSGRSVVGSRLLIDLYPKISTLCIQKSKCEASPLELRNVVSPPL